LPAENFLILFLLIIIFEAANTCLQQGRLNLIGLDTHPSFLAQSQGLLILGLLSSVTLSSKSST